MNTRFMLAEGLVIFRHGRTLEYARRAGKTIQFSDVENGLVTTFTEPGFFEEFTCNELLILPKTVSTTEELFIPDSPKTYGDTDSHTLDLSEIKSARYRANIVRRHAYVTRVRRAGITKGQLKFIADEIPRIAKDIDDARPPGAITVATWMRRFERQNFDAISITDRCAIQSTRQHRSAEHNEIIDDLLKKLFLKQEPKGIQEIHEIYDKVMSNWNAERTSIGLVPERAISKRTLYRIVSGLNLYDVKVAQLGREQARHLMRFMKGHLQAKRALQYVEIDHALLDIFVIDDYLMIPLGRPWLTVFRDRLSGAIIGLYVSFTGPSTDAIFAALRHSLYPHDQVRTLWPDIETELPHGLGERYVSDRGPDFLSQRYRLGIIQLGADYEYCQVRTPWLKGAVERFFLTLTSLLETIPGKTFRSLGERKDYNPAKHAVCRFSSFIWILYKWAADGYNNRRSRTKLAPPIELFNESIATYPPSYPRNPHAVETILGERHESMLHHDGILFKGLNYLGDDLENLYNAIGPKNNVIWHANNANLGSIRVQDPRTQKFILCPCSRPDYANGRSLLQHTYLRKLASKEFDKDMSVDSLKRTMISVRERIGDEVFAKETSGKKRLAQLTGLNSESVFSGEKRTVADPFQRDLRGKTEDITSGTDGATIGERTFVDVPNFGWSVH